MVGRTLTDAIISDPSSDEIKPYYDEKIVDEVLDKIEAVTTDASKAFWEQQLKIEEMLDDLYYDLIPEEIDPIIVSGHCNKCPQ